MAGNVALMNVSPTEMLNIAALIENDIDDWNNAVKMIYQLHGEMDGMWDGNANDAFNTLFTEDKAKFERLSEVLYQYAQAIRQIAENYMRGEDEVKQIVTRR